MAFRGAVGVPRAPHPRTAARRVAIEVSGGPEPAAPLLRRRPSSEGDDDVVCGSSGDGEQSGAWVDGTESSAAVGTEGEVAAPRRASGGASPAASPAAAAPSNKVSDDSKHRGEGEGGGGGGGGGDDSVVACKRSKSM